jgi:hypothetical protein
MWTIGSEKTVDAQTLRENTDFKFFVRDTLRGPVSRPRFMNNHLLSDSFKILKKPQTEASVTSTLVLLTHVVTAYLTVTGPRGRR